MVLTTDNGRRTRQHLARGLGVREAFQAAFAQRVEGNDLSPTVGGLLQLMHHTRTVSTDVLTKEKNAISFGEIC